MQTNTNSNAVETNPSGYTISGGGFDSLIVSYNGVLLTDIIKVELLNLKSEMVSNDDTPIIQLTIRPSSINLTTC